jgi:hypothetical protein
MSKKGSGLAARFRRAVQQRKTAVESAEAEQERLEAEAVAARLALFEELGAFAVSTGFLSAARDGDTLVLSHEGRSLRFEQAGRPEHVRVVPLPAAEGETHLLYRQVELGDRWIWQYHRGRREYRLPLFDDGLEELLVRGLGLPRPGEEEPEAADPGAPRDKRL